MSSLRKFLAVVAAVLLSTFALPASAATKSITATAPTGPLTASASVQQINVIITNSGNSNANSFEVDWQNSPFFTVQSGSVGGGSPVTPISPAEKGAGWSGVLFLQQLPTKASVTITLNVIVTAPCVASSVTWFGWAWTGAPGSASQSFPLDSAHSQLSTQLPAAAACTLGFVTQPTSATVSTTITGTAYNTAGTPVSVGLFSGATQDPSFAGPVSLAIKSGTGTNGAVLSGNTTPTFSNGTASFPSLMIDTAGANYQLTATSNALNVDSNQFWITAADGTVNCSDANYAKSPTGNLDPNQTFVDFMNSDPGDWGLRRGPNSLDGSNNNCKKVGISVTFSGNVATFLYDKTIPLQQANFKYWIIWPETAVNADNTSETSFDGTNTDSTARFGEKRPLVSWDGNGNYVPILNCASDDLTQGSVLMPQIPSVAPFTGFASTSPYYPGKFAQVCLAQHIVISSGTSGGVFQVMYADKIVDQVDTLVKQP